MGLEDPLNLGMLGMHGSRATNLAVDRADLLIALGVRFDDRATGAVAGFAPRARVIHMDIDEAEIGKIRRPDISTACDVKSALRRLNKMVARAPRKVWLEEIDALRREHPSVTPSDKSHPANLVKRIAAIASRDAIVTVDVGQHQMWAAQWWPVRRTRSFLTSGGLGTMGFSVPAAMGAALANPHTPVVVIVGDGSLLINIQELATIAETQLDIKICVFNNGHLGLVRQQQELFYGERYVASRFDARPDYAAIAKGFGIAGHTIRIPHDDHPRHRSRPGSEAPVQHLRRRDGPHRRRRLQHLSQVRLQRRPRQRLRLLSRSRMGRQRLLPQSRGHRPAGAELEKFRRIVRWPHRHPARL